MEVHRRQRRSSRPPATRPCRRPGSRTSAASRSASSVRSPRTCPSWSRPTASRTSRSPTSSTATNAAADDLKAEGADVVVLLVHEGAPTPTSHVGDDPASRLRQDRQRRRRRRRRDRLRPHPPGLQPPVPVPGVGGQDRAVTERPVVSAGQYGTNLNQLALHASTRTPARCRHPARASSRCRPTTVGHVPSRPTTRPTRPPSRSSTPPSPRPTCSARGARQDRRPVQPGQALATARENRGRRVHPGQPGRRGPAVGDRSPDAGCGADRLHEPGRPAPGHGRRGTAATRAR